MFLYEHIIKNKCMGKRLNHSLTVRLPKDLERALARESKHGKSVIVRTALCQYLEKNGGI